MLFEVIHPVCSVLSFSPSNLSAAFFGGTTFRKSTEVNVIKVVTLSVYATMNVCDHSDYPRSLWGVRGKCVCVCLSVRARNV